MFIDITQTGCTWKLNALSGKNPNRQIFSDRPKLDCCRGEGGGGAGSAQHLLIIKAYKAPHRYMDLIQKISADLLHYYVVL